MDVPDYATHYYLPDRMPFLNLSDLDPQESKRVMRELVDMRKQGRQHRRFGARYLAWRHLTEARLQQLFIDAGGVVHRKVPHYFVLGSSDYFRGLAPGMLSISLPLLEFPEANTSFTLVDSFEAMGFGPEFGYEATAEPHQRQVYRLNQFYDTLADYQPGIDEILLEYSGYERRPVTSYVEVQLWSDVPLGDLVLERR